MIERMVRVRLEGGGPKNGWVYDVPLHWERSESGQGSVWLPPESIETPVGSYRLPASTLALGRDRLAEAVAVTVKNADRGSAVAYEWVPESNGFPSEAFCCAFCCVFGGDDRIRTGE